MLYEDEQLRRALESRARKARKFGEQPDVKPQVHPTGTVDDPVRENARFFDATGLRLWLWAGWGAR
jgi:hypothetical protein